jgi:hypothetical protein
VNRAHNYPVTKEAKETELKMNCYKRMNILVFQRANIVVTVK